MNFDPTGAPCWVCRSRSPTGPNIHYRLPVRSALHDPGASRFHDDRHFAAELLRSQHGHEHHHRSGIANNVPPRRRSSSVTLPVGSYFVAFQLVSGPIPGHVEFSNSGDSARLAERHDRLAAIRRAGGIYYPTSVGHEPRPTRSASARCPGGHPRLSEPEPAYQRALQLDRAGDPVVLNPNGTPMATPLRCRTRPSPHPTAATPRSSSGQHHRHQQQPSILPRTSPRPPPTCLRTCPASSELFGGTQTPRPWPRSCCRGFRGSIRPRSGRA